MHGVLQRKQVSMPDDVFNACRALVKPFPSLFDRALLSVLNAIKPNNNRWSMAFSLKAIKGLAADAGVALSRAVQVSSCTVLELSLHRLQYVDMR